MGWHHRCKKEWMENRRHYLTASDVKELLPFTKTGKNRTVTEDDYVSVMMRKLATVSEDKLVSTGAAARGHIMEPYAVRHYNENYVGPGIVDLYHWDDVVVAKEPEADYSNTLELDMRQFEFRGLAFSPDACDVEMDEKSVFSCLDCKTKPKVIGEIKCYGNDRHVASVMASVDPSKLEERWQIATAMAVRTSIDSGHLVFFNPDIPMASMCVVEYTRTNLAKEIETVRQVEKEWTKVVDKVCDHPELYFHDGVYSCLDILGDMIRSVHEMNP